MPIDFSAIARGANDKLNQSGLKPYLLPAAVGAAAGGPLMAYMASKNHNQDESPKERRHRILRNALMGLTMGGVAGAAIPAGVDTISNAVNKPPGFHPVDAAQSFGLRHAGGAAAGLGGGVWAAKHIGGNKHLAAQNIVGLLHPNENPVRGDAMNKLLETTMERAHNPHTQGGVIQDLSTLISGKNKSKLEKNVESLVGQDPEGRANQWAARERLGEAGVRVPRISETTDPIEKAQLLKELPEHLKGQGMFSNMAAESIPAMQKLRAALPEGVAKLLPADHAIAEGFSRYMRPTISGRLGYGGGLRLGTPGTLALAGAGVLGADYLQNKLMSND